MSGRTKYRVALSRIGKLTLYGVDSIEGGVHI